jgi:hypothetical protein
VVNLSKMDAFSAQKSAAIENRLNICKYITFLSVFIKTNGQQNLCVNFQVNRLISVAILSVRINNNEAENNDVMCTVGFTDFDKIF